LELWLARGAGSWHFLSGSKAAMPDMLELSPNSINDK